jgi:hypothetical protein
MAKEEVKVKVYQEFETKFLPMLAPCAEQCRNISPIR